MPSSKLSKKPKFKAPATPEFQLNFDAIGTVWHVTLNAQLSQTKKRQLQQRIAELIDAFDKHYSRFRDDSLITTMSRQAGHYQLPANAQPLFDLYHKLYVLTDGAMTPLVGQLLSDAGYDAEYSLRPKALQATPSWDEIIDYDFPHLLLTKPALLDLGAAGKGYLVDLVAELIMAAGVEEFFINAGGDILQRSQTVDLAVGLEHPADASQAVGIAQLRNRSLCSSAGNRRVWGEYHHIIDPRNQQSPRHLRAVWVVADSTLLADGLSTALFFVSPKQLEKCYAYEYALVREDFSLQCSANFPAEFFTAESSQS